MQGAAESLGQAVDEVVKELREKFRSASRDAGILDSLRAFVAAVDWTEPWIIGLLIVQALLLLTALSTRKKLRVQFCIFAIAAATVYSAERLNRVLGQHWRKFSRQPYFDEHGIFASAVLSAPLLCTMLILLVNYLMTTSQLLIEMKRKELMYKARQSAKMASTSNVAATATDVSDKKAQ